MENSEQFLNFEGREPNSPDQHLVNDEMNKEPIPSNEIEYEKLQKELNLEAVRSKTPRFLIHLHLIFQPSVLLLYRGARRPKNGTSKNRK
jgi:hypothetical protein